MVDEPRRRNLNLGPGPFVLKSEPLRIRGQIQTQELPISGISCGYRGWFASVRTGTDAIRPPAGTSGILFPLPLP